MLDIDYFKNFNDLYGHPAGDRCLTNLAQAVKQALHRFTDLVARYGGEEFIVILPNTTTSGATIVSDLIQQAIAELAIVHENSQVSNVVTTSIGIASLVPQDQQQPSILIEKADRALYRAKKEGRNRYSVDI
jgi:diguanylate cyclase (GGDEF)-like protein